MAKEYLGIVCVLLLAWPAFGGNVGVGDPSPSFALETIESGVVRSDDFRGEKGMFLVFWATWCSTCREEIPELKRIYGITAARGVGFVAVNIGLSDSLTRVKGYVAKHGVTYPVAYDGGSHVTKMFRVRVTPTIIILDQEGVICYRSAFVPRDLQEYFHDLTD